MVEVDSDSEDDFDDADLKKKFESQEIQRKITADFSDLDLDGDGSITMKELIAKLNPSASASEKEELEVIVSSARNFDLIEGNINMREMITCCSTTTTITKSSSTIIENKLTEEKGPVDYIEMKKMYQKQFNTRERAGFLKEFDLNKDGYVTMKEIKQRIQEKKADLFKDLDVDGDGNIAIKEMITKLNPTILEKKIYEKNGPARRRHYGYLDSTLASKNKERNVTAQLSAPGLEGGPPELQGKEIITQTSFSSQQKEVGQIITRTSATTTTTSFSKVNVTRAESSSSSDEDK